MNMNTLDRWAQAAVLRSLERLQHGKLLLAYNQIPLPRLECAELTRVALIERDPSSATTLEPLRARDAARSLWESAGVPLCRLNREVQQSPRRANL